MVSWFVITHCRTANDAEFRRARAVPAMAPTADCRFGRSCTRTDCTFKHPDGRAADTPAASVDAVPWVPGGKFGERRCREGMSCRNAQCGFAHPATWIHFHGSHGTPAAAAPSLAATVNTPGGFGGGFSDAFLGPGGQPRAAAPPRAATPPQAQPPLAPQSQRTAPPRRQISEEVSSLDDF